MLRMIWVFGVCVVVVLGFGARVGFAAGGEGKGGVRPNVLVILVDDLNDWVGFLGGHGQARTPHMDELARRGVVFSNAHTAAPSCNPARVALMSGIRPTTSGVYNNSQVWREIMPDAVMLSQLFSRNGYRSIGAGKVYHGRYPDPKGWDEEQELGVDVVPEGRPLNGFGKDRFDWGPVEVGDEEMADHKLVSWVIERIREGAGGERPWFMVCAINKTHFPWYAPRKYFEMFPLETVELPAVKEGDLEDVPEIARKMAGTKTHQMIVERGEWRKAVQSYLASIAFVDAQVGRLLGALEASGQAGRTIVVLVSDHGHHVGEKEHWGKVTLWEVATRVPLIVAAPGMGAEGARCGKPVDMTSLYATVAELAGLSVGEGVEGASFAKLVREPGAAWDGVAISNRGFGNHAVRDERWRYIRYSDGSEELYDHASDPREWKNLAGEAGYEKVKRELGRRIPKVNVPEKR